MVMEFGGKTTRASSSPNPLNTLRALRADCTWMAQERYQQEHVHFFDVRFSPMTSPVGSATGTFFWPRWLKSAVLFYSGTSSTLRILFAEVPTDAPEFLLPVLAGIEEQVAGTTDMARLRCV